MTINTADHLRDASPWRAEPDPIKLAILGKIIEELGELVAASGRCVIQGINATHPVTGKPNIEWFWEEVVDVSNLMNFARQYCPYGDDAEWEKRLERKRQHIQQWLDSFK